MRLLNRVIGELSQINLLIQFAGGLVQVIVRVSVPYGEYLEPIGQCRCPGWQRFSTFRRAQGCLKANKLSRPCSAVTRSEAVPTTVATFAANHTDCPCRSWSATVCPRGTLECFHCRATAVRRWVYHHSTLVPAGLSLPLWVTQSTHRVVSALALEEELADRQLSGSFPLASFRPWRCAGRPRLQAN